MKLFPDGSIPIGPRMSWPLGKSLQGFGNIDHDMRAGCAGCHCQYRPIRYQRVAGAVK
jgi:hypothetical protein